MFSPFLRTDCAFFRKLVILLSLYHKSGEKTSVNCMEKRNTVLKKKYCRFFSAVFLLSIKP